MLALQLGRPRPTVASPSAKRTVLKPSAVGCKLRRVLAHAAFEVPHIDSNFIMFGSTAISIALPTFAGQFFRNSKVDTVPASEAFMALGPRARLVDIRTRAQIRKQGVPLTLHEASWYYNPQTQVIHAPKMLVERGKLRPNPHFEDEVLFAEGVHADTSFVILDADGSDGPEAASKIARLGNRHDICVVKGGFEAWKAAGLQHEALPAREEKRYFCETLKMHAETLASMSGGGPTPGEVMLDSGSRNTPIFRPKILDVLANGYTADDLKQDVLAGVTIGIIALSLSMALGIASESTPAIGLYTAIVAGFIISALGGSKVVVGGPTAAFIPIVVGIAHEYGPAKLIASTALAGAMLIGMGATGMGSLVKFVPRPVVTGFTAGIAVYIFSTQIKDFLGMGVPGHLPPDVVIPSEFMEKIMYLGVNVGATHGPSLALATIALAFMKFYPASWAKVVPSQIAAVVGGTLALAVLDGPMHLGSGIETIGSHFGAGAIPNRLPMPGIPEALSLDTIPELIKPAATIALLAAIESLLCARVSDTMVGDRHNPNTELIAQGTANIASAAFGALPVTGALARTAANVRAGARSPVSGMVHSVTILAIILVASPLAQYVPLPCLAAVLVVVAVNMGEWHNFTYLPAWPEKDAQLFLLAFTLTLLQDVAVAVEFGMAAALLLFVRDVTSSIHVRAIPPGRPLPPSSGSSTLNGATLASTLALPSHTSHTSHTTSSTHSHAHAASPADSMDSVLAPQVVPQHAAYLEVSGSLLFGAGDLLEDALAEVQSNEPVTVVLLDMSHVSVMDVSGLEVMEEQAKRLHRSGKQIVICGLCRQPLRMLSKAGFLDELGRANVCRNLEQALQRAAVLADNKGDSGVGAKGLGDGPAAMPAAAVGHV